MVVTHRFLDRLPSLITVMGRVADYSGENNNYSVQHRGKTNSAATLQQQRAQLAIIPSLVSGQVVTPPPATLGTNIFHSIVIMTSTIDSGLQAVKNIILMTTSLHSLPRSIIYLHISRF